ncbi:MAG: alpha/beta hydrolase [Flavobacteriales bacterium]|nr:MAG: alpha/beta hydrolase [Flavobacteriales bacterium]|tara:strand:- start:1484 stop:2125 length:642 start_codon:yes stop_codon:yes gene_type:complete
MPGMSANPLIFKRIKFSDEKYEIHFLKWAKPVLNESIENYSKRLLDFIKHKNPILIGVSFGGLIVQEISKLIDVEKVIIISSIKSNRELPLYMKSAKFLKLYNYFPLKLFDDVFNISKSLKINKIYKKLDLIDKYLSVRDENYLKWAIREILNWKQEKPLQEVIHIHGDKDLTFPISLIKDCIIVPGATHALILTKYRWLNKNLSIIIEEKKV